MSQTTIAKLSGLTVVIHHCPKPIGIRCQNCIHYEGSKKFVTGNCKLMAIGVLPVWQCINFTPIEMKTKESTNEQLFD